MSALEFPDCPKCREDDPTVIYLDRGGYGQTPGGYPLTCSIRLPGHEGEHFHLTCRRCGARYTCRLEDLRPNVTELGR